MLLKFGNITNINDIGQVKVKIPDLDDFTTEYLPLIVSNAKDDEENKTIDIDSFVAVILNDDLIDGVCLGAVNTKPGKDRNVWSHKFSDGSIFSYDRKSSKFSADVKGIAEIKASQMTIKGPFNVDGPITSTADISDAAGSMNEIRARL